MNRGIKKSRDVSGLLPWRGSFWPAKKFVRASMMVLLKAKSIIK
jgi:hypothetical protein